MHSITDDLQPSPSPAERDFGDKGLSECDPATAFWESLLLCNGCSFKPYGTYEALLVFLLRLTTQS